MSSIARLLTKQCKDFGRLSMNTEIRSIRRVKTMIVLSLIAKMNINRLSYRKKV